MKECIRCEIKMEAGMLPGWYTCRNCQLFIDDQAYGKGKHVIQYRLAPHSPIILCPEYTLLVVKDTQL